MAKTKIHHLYNNEFQIIFYQDAHRYKHSYKKGWLTGVTTVLNKLDKSAPLLKWSSNLTSQYLFDKYSESGIISMEDVTIACNLYKEKKEKAADIGSQIHQWIDEYLNFKFKKQDEPDTPENEQVKNGIMAFLEWINSNEVEFIEHEKVVYSKEYDYVGTFDALAKVGKEVFLIDYKSSKGIYTSMRYQTAAYLKAYNEEMKTDYTNRMILKLGKDDGEFRSESLVGLIPLEEDFKAFIGLLNVHRREKELYQWQLSVNK